jgi:hypothetical protein
MEMEQMMECLLARMDEMNTNAKANQEDLLARMDSNQAKATKQEEMLAKLNAKMDANLVVIKSTINAFKEKMEPNPEENEVVVEHPY